jgi:hypothetical protein
MAQLNKDLHLTAEFLALLRSGFYGQVLFEGTLVALNSSFAPNNYLDIAHKAFDKVDSWMKDLVAELPIFSVSWQSPETFDAISAMNFMRDLRKDFLFIVPPIESALSMENLSQDREAVKLLVAALVRSAATRNSYVENLTKAYSLLKAHEMAQQIGAEVEQSREYLRITRLIQDKFMTTAAFDDRLCEQLRIEAILTACDFRALAHDSNIMLNVFSKEFTYEMVDFNPGEADDWRSNKVSAVAAGYWRAYGFGPEDFLDWKRHGITGAPLAANWARFGFTADQAIEWINEGVPPMIALMWRSAGFQPKRAAIMLSRGIIDPAKAPRPEAIEDENLNEDEDQN